MSLPLNGFHQDGGMEPQSYSPEQTDRRVGAVEDWPDWSDHDDGESRDGHSVQIHIQAAKRVNSVSSQHAPRNTEEEPWDDFEDTEPTSDLSPSAPFSDSVVLTPPGESTSTASAKPSPTPLRLDSSKPLKLTTTVRQSAQSKNISSWDSAWVQEETDSQKPHSPSNPESKATVPQKIGGIGGLGEEFTIKVKKKVEQDPELDLFADMVPDIKLSSPAVLPLEEGSRLSAASSPNTRSLLVDSPIDTLTLTAKFAAANLSEVSVC